MYTVNELLDRCVVQHENDCIPSAGELLKIVDEILTVLRVGGQPVDAAIPRRCQVCGRDYYQLLKNESSALGEMAYIKMDVYGCANCGHIQMFGRRDTKWTGPLKPGNPRF